MSRGWSLFLSMLVFVLGTGVSHGATVTVTTTINVALETLDYNDGFDDVCIVPPGTYDEQLTPNGNQGFDSTAFPTAAGFASDAQSDAAFTSHTDHLTIRAQDPNNPPVVTLDTTLGQAYTVESTAYKEDVWAPIVWLAANNVTLENIEVGSSNAGFTHLAGQGSGLEFNDCAFTVLNLGPGGGLIGMGRNGEWANPINTPDAFNEWTFRNCLVDFRSQTTGLVEENEGGLLFDSYFYPNGGAYIDPSEENGFLLCDSCIFNDFNDEAFTFRAHDDLIWEDGCPHTGLENCQIYEHECRYNCAPRFWTFQDCYFARNREDELYRVRGITGDLTYDRCVFEDCSINEGETNGSIFSFEDRHRTWFVKIAVTNCIIANCDTETNSGPANHLINILAAYQSAHNPANPPPSVHIVNNTIFNTKGTGALLFANNIPPGNDPELANPDDDVWPAGSPDGFGIIRPRAVPEVIIANNIIYGSDTAPLGTLFNIGARNNFNLINNNIFALADADTSSAHSTLGTIAADPLFASTAIAPPANAGDPLPGTPLVPAEATLGDAGDAAAYAASGGGSEDVDGTPRLLGAIDIGAQEFSGVLMVRDWQEY